MAERRKLVAEMVEKGKARRLIAEKLFNERRDLVPSDSVEAAFAIVVKDVQRYYDDIRDARISKLPEVARNLHAARWKRLYEHNMEIAEDKDASEQYRAASMKLAMQALEKWGLLEGVDPVKVAERICKEQGQASLVESWEVEVGAGGIPVPRQIAAPAEEEKLSIEESEGVVIDVVAKEVSN